MSDQVCAACGGSLLNEAGDGQCEHCKGSGIEPDQEKKS